MNVKQLFGTVTGFLGHHVNDLDAVAKALAGVLSALPINAETRANINALIARVEQSAKNVADSLTRMGVDLDAGTPVVHIAESDLSHALASDDFKAVVAAMVSDYMRAHPAEAGTVAQSDSASRTADRFDAQARTTTVTVGAKQEGAEADPGAVGGTTLPDALAAPPAVGDAKDAPGDKPGVITAAKDGKPVVVATTTAKAK